MAIVIHLDVMLARRKIKSRELAAYVGITEQNLSLLKSGKVKGIRFGTLEKICEKLQCQPGDIIAWTPEPGETAAGTKACYDGRMENDFCLVRRCLIPADAFILCGCLRAAGLNATVMDDQHVQAAFLLAAAIGGARVMVPQAELAQALEVLAALERGELALDDDADVGGARVYQFTPRK